MGKLSCLKCKAFAEGETPADADVLIDHAAPSKKCSGHPSYLRWNGERISRADLNKVVARSIQVPVKKSKK